MLLEIMAQEIKLSIQDLLDGRYESSLSKYLSLSIDYLEPDIHISITTADKEPTIYSTSISTAVPVDISALMFEMQAKNDHS
ncbi:MAG: hypothetical protein ABSB19_02045 [Methylomonas sp.]|jgi:hypothetical protein